MRLRRVSVIATLSLLAWAATASAGCAWLLWSSFQGAQYVITSTHEDRVGCVRAIDLNLIRWGGLKYADGSTPGIDVTALTDGKGRFWTAGRDGKVIGLGEYVCLPDTVDPRGPKGGEK